MYFFLKASVRDPITVLRIEAQRIEEQSAHGVRMVQAHDLATLKKRCEEFLAIPLIQSLNTEDL